MAASQSPTVTRGIRLLAQWLARRHALRLVRVTPRQ